MEKDITGKTIDEAVEKACRELNAERGTFSYEIVDYPKQGFLGIGGRPAVIRISYRTQEEIEAEKKAEEAERAAREEWDAQNPRSDRGPRAPRGDRGPKKDRGPRMNRAPRPEPEEPVEEPFPEPEAEKELVFCENTKIEKFLVGMFETMGVTEYEIHVTDEDQKESTVEIQSEQLSFLVGIVVYQQGKRRFPQSDAGCQRHKEENGASSGSPCGSCGKAGSENAP